jgi:hypothetical protein
MLRTMRAAVVVAGLGALHAQSLPNLFPFGCGYFRTTANQSKISCLG